MIPGFLIPLERRSLRFRVLLVVLLIVFSASDLFAGPTMQNRSRQGLAHHGQGYGGAGICPQPRFTVKAPDNIFSLKNPLKGTRGEILEGESYFQRDVQPTACKVCHGPGGNGMGMMAIGLNPPPRNFTCKQTMKDVTDGQMYWIIKNGSQGTGMPAFADLPDDVIWKMVLYIRSLEK
jgi:mono/diheme cytochrome c family protein